MGSISIKVRKVNATKEQSTSTNGATVYEDFNIEKEIRFTKAQSVGLNSDVCRLHFLSLIKNEGY